MNALKRKQIKQQVIFLLIFFVVVGFLILFSYLDVPIQMSILLPMMPIAFFAIYSMFRDYKKGIFSKRLFLGPTSSYLTIKKHPIRAAINFMW